MHKDGHYGQREVQVPWQCPASEKQVTDHFFGVAPSEEVGVYSLLSVYLVA